MVILSVDTNELGSILHDMGVDLSHDMLKIVLKDIDHDGTGDIDLLEFIGLVSPYRHAPCSFK